MDERDDIHIEPEMGDESRRNETETVDDESRMDVKVKKLRDELEACKKEKQEYLDGWQRAKADYVNALKRSESDIKAAKTTGLISAMEMLLPAFDAIERAKEHGEIPSGFQAIAKQLEGAFVSLGLLPIGQIGEQFNPALHEALGQDPAKSSEEDDTITAILEKGWKVGDTIIRPAKVRVAHFSQ